MPALWVLSAGRCFLPLDKRVGKHEFGVLAFGRSNILKLRLHPVKAALHVMMMLAPLCSNCILLLLALHIRALLDPRLADADVALLPLLMGPNWLLRRYMGHMTLIANRVSAASARRRVVRGYLDASAEWEEYYNGYLRVRGCRVFAGRVCVVIACAKRPW